MPSRFVLILSLSCLLQSQPVIAQTLNTNTYWFGNTYGNRVKQDPTMGDAVAHRCEDLYAAANGRLYCNAGYDEGWREGQIFNSNGTIFGELEVDRGSGGRAIVGDNGYLYLGFGPGPNSNQTAVKGSVARFNYDGSPAPWSGSTYSRQIDPSGTRIPGLAVFDSELFVAANNTMTVLDTADFSIKRSWPIPSPGQLTVDASGFLWIINSATNQVQQWTRGSGTQPGSATDKVISDLLKPADVALGPNGSICVADNGNNRCHIRVYVFSNGMPTFSNIIGRSDLRHPQPGTVSDLGFYEIRSLAFDLSGVMYVADSVPNQGQCNRIRKYDSNRVLQWTRHGHMHRNGADADPGEDTSVHTSFARYQLDYSAAPGSGWTHKAWTVDNVNYPNDPRLILEYDYTQACQMFRRNGKKFMVTKRDGAGIVAIFRFVGEIAVPTVIFRTTVPGTAFFPNEPSGTQWMWRDNNADGNMQATEYTSFSMLKGWAESVDANGNVWFGEEVGLKVFRFQLTGVNGQGVPNYSGPTVATIPAGPNRLMRAIYVPTTDRMYLGTYSPANPYDLGEGNWSHAGKEIRCYDQWSSIYSGGTPTQRFLLTPPYVFGDPTKTVPRTLTRDIDIEGGYLFLGYRGNRSSAQVPNDNAIVKVYRATDASFIGDLRATASVGNTSGWLDIVDGLQTHRRANGTILIFAEEQWQSKINFYQWTPN
jgi:hypothetical protein